jgi:hypothetical protein|tara:strand:- start:4561 stop:4827 length:267 start_codon:yes stop_codon:yes gene_type:complete
MRIYLNENSKEAKVNQKLESLTNKGIDRETLSKILVQSLKFIEILKESAEKDMSAQLSKTFISDNNASITLEAETSKQQSFLKTLKSI